MVKILYNTIKIGRFLESIIGDCWLNINSRGSVYFDKKRGQNQDAFDFETIAHSNIVKTIRLIQPSPMDVVFVLGCGKGRAVCHLARWQVQKVIGIELSQELSELAKRNSLTLRGKASPIEIYNIDVSTANFREGTIFFMFNPFGEQTLRDVLRKIEISRDLHSSPVTIVYVNAVYADIFNEIPWLNIEIDYKQLNGQRVIIYKNQWNSR